MVAEEGAASKDSLRRIIALDLREVTIVKLADRVVNMEPPPKLWPADKRTRYHREAKEILEGIGHASTTLSAHLQEKIARDEGHLDPANEDP